jgi:ADP-ribose pyrophosphatase YjhB (NUDIX family)
MGYIEELRMLVGSRPLIMVGAGALILNPAGELLLLRRTDNQSWSIPGGSLEPGETLLGCARRETREETGLELGELELFEVFSGPEHYYRYPNGDEVYNVSAVYLARQVHGRLHVDGEEHSQVRFFALDALPEPISPPVIPVIKKFLAGGWAGKDRQ